MFHIYSYYFGKEKITSLVIEPSCIPNKAKSNDGVTYLFRDNKLIGINFFNVELSTTSIGLEKKPSKELIDQINSYLTKEGLDKLDYVSNSSFLVFEVERREEHPVFEKQAIVTLKGLNDTLTTVTRYSNFKIGDHLVCLVNNGARLDGTFFKERIEKNIPIQAEINSPKDLRIGEDEKDAYITSLPIGADFFA